MLLAIPAFREALMYESRRQHNDEIMSDVYDSPRWKALMGVATATLRRIGLHLCVDGVPSFKRKELLSIKPVQYLILSLPPKLRYQACNMLVQMLLPAHLKGQQSKKYYDFVATDEMNDLHRRGVDGVRVVLYGVTLDTPGRRELLSLQSVQAFYPCGHCLHTWQSGTRGLVYGGYRRFLPLDSRWRRAQFEYRGNRYYFRDEERRPPPTLRTDDSAAVMTSLAKKSRPFCGHKVVPCFLNRWIGHSWSGHACDIMHDTKLACEMLLKCMVGYRKTGMYSGWNLDEHHRLDCQIYGMFPEFASGAQKLPPWRLDRAALSVLDDRIKSMWWPHYMDILCKNKHSFFTHSDRMYKACHKNYILMVILPVVLRGFVPALLNALLMVVHALRRLAGHVISQDEAEQIGAAPGARVLHKRDLAALKMELLFGLVLLEGCLPVAKLNPALHHLVHYASQVNHCFI